MRSILWRVGLTLITGAHIPYSYGQLTPITLTAASYTQDVIAESGSNPNAVTTAAIDGGAANIFYSQAFRTANSSVITSGGLPNSGTLTNGANSWQLTAYSSNNALFFPAQTAVSTQSLFISSPAAYSQISLLDVAGYGPTSVTITLLFTDGSSSNYGNFSILDWFDQTPYVVDSLGRITRNTTVSNNNAPASDPRLYQTVINLNGADQVKHLSQISILDNITNNQATAAFLAVSGIATTTLALNTMTLSGTFQADMDEAILTWQVTNTSNVDLFEIQRSADGTTFTTIGTLYPPASGNVFRYTFVDKDVPENQDFLYRLVGTSTIQPDWYSNIIELRTAAGNRPKFSVSQSFGMLYVNTNMPSTPTAFEIVGLSGQVLIKGVAPPTSRFEVDVRQLVHGIYMIHLQASDQSRTVGFLR